MQDWYERGFKFGLSEGEHRLTQATNIIRDLQYEILRLNEQLNSRIHDLESRNRELSFQLKLYVNNPHLINKLTKGEKGDNDQ